QPYLRTLTTWISLGNLFSSAFFTLLVVYFVRELHWGAATIGWATAVVNLGFVAAALVNGRLVRRFGVGPMIVYTGLVSPLALLVVPSAPRSLALAVIVPCGFAGTFLAFFMNVNQLTLRQAITPPRLLGRMNSVARFAYWGTMPLGSALGGLLADGVGLRATLFCTAVGSILATVPIALSPIRKLRELPHAEPEPALSVEPLEAVRGTVDGDARAAGDGGVAAPAQ
ncbi:MAG: MFS transporter, partial [Thermoleophilia bacterium]|nr:MFS transporter [Thermoleophilia bacterium]